jgi:hypothetical protein
VVSLTETPRRSLTARQSSTCAAVSIPRAVPGDASVSAGSIRRYEDTPSYRSHPSRPRRDMSGLLNDLISRSWTKLHARLLMILTTGDGGWVGVCNTFQNRDRRGFSPDCTIKPRISTEVATTPYKGNHQAATTVLAALLPARELDWRSSQTIPIPTRNGSHHLDGLSHVRRRRFGTEFARCPGVQQGSSQSQKNGKSTAIILGSMAA